MCELQQTRTKSKRVSLDDIRSNIRDYSYYNFGSLRRTSLNDTVCEKSDASLSLTFNRKQRSRMSSLPVQNGLPDPLCVGGFPQSSCNSRSDISSSHNLSGETQGSIYESNVDHTVYDSSWDGFNGRCPVSGSRRGSLSGDISGSNQKRLDLFRSPKFNIAQFLTRYYLSYYGQKLSFRL